MKNLGSKAIVIALVSVLSLGSVSANEEHKHHEKEQVVSEKNSAAIVWTAGEVKKVQIERERVTIKHEEIKNLDMPPMSMVFAASKELLSQIKEGDRIEFHAEKVNGSYRVLHLKKVSP